MAFRERKCLSLQNLDPFLSFWLDFCCCCCCCCRCCGCCYCYCSCCCLPSPYRAACATRGTRSGRRWPGDRGGNCPACLRPTPALSGMRAGRCANAPARHVPVVTTGFPPGPCALASGCAWHGRLLSSKWKSCSRQASFRSMYKATAGLHLVRLAGCMVFPAHYQDTSSA